MWTRDSTRKRVAMPLIKIGHVPTPPGHEMVHVVLHVVLNDGREFRTPPGHSTADCRIVGELGLGTQFDGGVVLSIDRELYGQPDTYEVLPVGGSELYWAASVLLHSTLIP